MVLTWDAEEIAGKLMDMEDQGKLRKIVSYLKDHLKHPDRTWEEKEIALGRMGMNSLNGPLTKRQALEAVRKPSSPPQRHSWLVEATTKDGRRWRNGVRLGTKGEAEVYVESYVPFDLEKAGYASAGIIRSDGDEANCFITRRRKGGRPTFSFEDGQCVLQEWQPVT